jgi:hypothetical protein
MFDPRPICGDLSTQPQNPELHRFSRSHLFLEHWGRADRAPLLFVLLAARRSAPLSPATTLRLRLRFRLNILGEVVLANVRQVSFVCNLICWASDESISSAHWNLASEPLVVVCEYGAETITDVLERMPITSRTNYLRGYWRGRSGNSTEQSDDDRLRDLDNAPPLRPKYPRMRKCLASKSGEPPHSGSRPESPGVLDRREVDVLVKIIYQLLHSDVIPGSAP